MKIVWLKSEPLLPLDKGGKIRTYHTLKYLCRSHRVTYLTLDERYGSSDGAPHDEYCHELIRVPIKPPRRNSLGFYRDLAFNTLSPLPYVVARYRAAGMTRQLNAILRAGNVDLVICDFLTPSPNVPDGITAPTLLFQHNVEARIWERHVAVATNPLARAYLRLQWAKMRRYERRQCHRFDHVVAVSEEDRADFERLYGAPSVSSVPTGVDTAYFAPLAEDAAGAEEVVFVGSMDWMPNEDGVRWFANEVLPLLRQRRPAVKFTVVGRDPNPDLRALGRALGIGVTGTVPDVRPYLARAGVVVVPLRIGGGTRLKIFEAMSMSKAVVSTTVGAEGLALEDGAHLRLADEPGTFAAAIDEVLGDRNTARRLGRQAAEFVRARFSWEASGEAFERACLSAVERKHQGAVRP